MQEAGLGRNDLMLRHLLATYAIVGGLGFSFVSSSLLPDQFRLDDITLREMMTSSDVSGIGGSFGNTAAAYTLLGLSGLPQVAATLGYMLGVAALIVAMRIAPGTPRGSNSQLMVMLIGCALCAVYLSQYSKEFYVLPIVILILLLPAGVWSELVVVLAIAAFASAFRQYWFLVGACYVTFRIVQLKSSTLRTYALTSVGLIVVLAFVYSAISGTAVRRIRVDTADSLKVVAATAIRPPVFPSPFEPIEPVYVWATMVFPFPLATRGLFYLCVSSGLLAVFVLLGLSIRGRCSGKYSSTAFERSVALIFACIAVLALFEPDYGSYIRHLTPLMPLICGVVGGSQWAERRKSIRVGG